MEGVERQNQNVEKGKHTPKKVCVVQPRMDTVDSDDDVEIMHSTDRHYEFAPTSPSYSDLPSRHQHPPQVLQNLQM